MITTREKHIVISSLSYAIWYCVMIVFFHVLLFFYHFYTAHTCGMWKMIVMHRFYVIQWSDWFFCNNNSRAKIIPCTDCINNHIISFVNEHLVQLKWCLRRCCILIGNLLMELPSKRECWNSRETVRDYSHVLYPHVFTWVSRAIEERGNMWTLCIPGTSFLISNHW